MEALKADITKQVAASFQGDLDTIKDRQAKAAAILQGQTANPADNSLFLDRAAQQGFDATLMGALKANNAAIEKAILDKIETNQNTRSQQMKDFQEVQSKYKNYDIPAKAQVFFQPTLERNLAQGMSAKEAAEATYKTIIETFDAKEVKPGSGVALPSGAAGGIPQGRAVKSDLEKRNDFAKALNERTRAARTRQRQPKQSN